MHFNFEFQSRLINQQKNFILIHSRHSRRPKVIQMLFWAHLSVGTAPQSMENKKLQLQFEMTECGSSTS